MLPALVLALAVSHCPTDRPAPTLHIETFQSGKPLLGWFWPGGTVQGGADDIYVSPEAKTFASVVIAHEVGHWCAYWTGGPWRSERYAQRYERKVLG